MQLSNNQETSAQPNKTPELPAPPLKLSEPRPICDEIVIQPPSFAIATVLDSDPTTRSEAIKRLDAEHYVSQSLSFPFAVPTPPMSSSDTSETPSTPPFATTMTPELVDQLRTAFRQFPGYISRNWSAWKSDLVSHYHEHDEGCYSLPALRRLVNEVSTGILVSSILLRAILLSPKSSFSAVICLSMSKSTAFLKDCPKFSEAAYSDSTYKRKLTLTPTMPSILQTLKRSETLSRSKGGKRR